MKYMLGLLIIFVVLDGVITNVLINVGIARESNPFLQLLVGNTGFILLKFAGAVLCSFILWDIYRHFPKVALIATRIFVAAYGIIVVWNASLFITA